MNRRDLARMIEHTLLAPGATGAEVARLCDEAVALGVGAVCVAPSRVAPAVARLRGSGVRVVSVAGFPHGNAATAAKVADARAAMADGADEVDMVMNVGALKDGDDEAVRRDVTAVADAVHGAGGRIKVIVEAAALTGDELERACAIAEAGGADFVKTSTGFGPGGATVDAVRRMRAAVSPRVGIKAAGGIRDYATARAMVDAGATRIGASASAAILSGAPE